MLSLLRQIAAAIVGVCLSPLAAIAGQVEGTTAGVNFIIYKRTWFPVHARLMVADSARIPIGPRGCLTLMTKRRCADNPVGRLAP